MNISRQNPADELAATMQRIHRNSQAQTQVLNNASLGVAEKRQLMKELTDDQRRLYTRRDALKQALRQR